MTCLHPRDHRVACASALATFAFAVAIAVVAPSHARAQRDTRYDEAITAAVEEYRLGNWAEATALFKRAHAIWPSARTHRGLGMSYFEAHEYGRAREHLRAALGDGRMPLTEKLREQVATLIRRIDAMVGEVHLRATPPDAVLYVDGKRYPWKGGPIVLLAGEHTFELRAANGATVTRIVELTSHVRIELELHATHTEGDTSAVAPLATASPVDAGESEVDDGAGVWPWVVVAVAGGTMIAGGVLTAMSLSDVSDVESAPQGSQWSDFEGTHESTATRSAVGIAMLAAGAVGVTVGIVWAATAGPEAPSVHASVGIDGVRVGGRF